MNTIILLSATKYNKWHKTIIVLFLITVCSQIAFTQAGKNPVLPGYQADPDIQYFEGKYYIYPTSAGGQQFHAFSSVDLTNWQDEGVIFDLATQNTWGQYNGWAPCMVSRNNKYYYYYAAAGNIGVAVGNTPIGPFTDKGVQLINSDPYTIDIIDPYVFVDTDGSAYIYYGGSYNSKMVIRKLMPNMVDIDFSFAPLDATPPYYTEGPHIFKRGNTYYLSYSNGAWYNDTYNARYATSNSPLGPWTYKGSLLANNGPFVGNGHHGIVKRPNCDEYYIAYHRYDDGSGARHVAVDRLYFDTNNGDMLQVNQTWAGVPARPTNAPCMVPNPVPDGTYWIQSKLNTSTGEPLVLEITGCNQSYGANVATWSANTSCLNQRWQLTYSNNFYSIINAEPNHLALDLEACNHDLNTNIIVYNSYFNNCQRWRIEETGTPGYYRIMSKQSGYIADVYGGSNVIGADIRAWEWYGQNNQVWKFSATLPVASPSKLEQEDTVSSAVNSATAAHGIMTYPNPADAEMIVNLTKQGALIGSSEVSNKPVSVKLFNTLGVMVKSSIVYPSNKIIKLDVKNIPNGNYYLQIINGKESVSKQVVIRHGQ